ncbi:MobH family relaxase [Pseudomonas aeruginosa]|uniref:MobH family relaxase n=1 Tax=Pseudomonas aeruginosa TaxID=287 RepID=UPI002ED3080C|nr:MobH family relaxase [Pseudomonas aeruginosa]
MLSLFQRKRPPVAAPSPAPATDLPKGLLRPESAASLLATPRRQKLLEHIWQRTSLSRRQFATLYRTPLEHYAELVQQFPASESHHHAYPGGMLDHGLEIVAYALKLRQSHLLPIGASPEDQAAQSEAWTAAVAYAALLHDIGKIAVDLHVELADGSVWHPWHGPLHQPYRFRYRDDREYRLHSAATGLLYRQLLDRDALDWLSGYPDLWGPLLYVLAGQYEHAGVLGELVVQADRASVAQELGGDPARAMAAPKHALQRKLLDGLRYLLKEELKLNQPEASDGWLTQDALWLVSKTVSDKLRAHLLSQGIDGIPASNTAVFNVLQDHGIGTQQDAEVVSSMTPATRPEASMPAMVTVSPTSMPTAATSPSTARPSGEHFMTWLQQGIASRRLIINDAKALVHTVSDTAYLVSPGVFQRYAQEHPQVAAFAKQENQQDWRWVQKRFERLQLHRKQASGLNIWTCEVTGPRKSRKLHGYLLLQPQSVFGDVPPNNPYLAVLPT